MQQNSRFESFVPLLNQTGRGQRKGRRRLGRSRLAAARGGTRWTRRSRRTTKTTRTRIAISLEPWGWCPACHDWERKGMHLTACRDTWRRSSVLYFDSYIIILSGQCHTRISLQTRFGIYPLANILPCNFSFPFFLFPFFLSLFHLHPLFSSFLSFYSPFTCKLC